VPELAEAAAALQDLAIGLEKDDLAPGLLGELAGLQAGLGPGIEVMTDGPYLVTNAGGLSDWLGQPLPVRPQLALCRCGGSKIKPLCDGTHAAIGFTGAKDPGRVPDRRDTCAGQQVTVYDNRGICQHSGFCTGRLATVFHQGGEPFVTPSGGRMDEIIRAVRDCPSGGAELRHRRRGGPRRDRLARRPRAGDRGHQGRPLRVTGGIPLTGGQGQPERRNAGAS
jgi:CDGSH-type Zn-finger protein